MKKIISTFVSLVVSATMWAANYYIAGDGNSTTGWCCGKYWDAGGCKLDNTNTYSVTVPAGTYQFKITTGSWSTNWGYSAVDATTSTAGYEDGGGNVKFTVAAEADITVSFNGTKITLTSSIPFGTVTITSWTVAGVTDIMGSDWDPADTQNDMTLVKDEYKLTKTNVALIAKGYDYKFCANHTWGIKELPASGNQTLTIAEAGMYDITFTLNATGTEGTAEATWVAPGPDYTYDTTMYVAGNFTSWEAGMQELPYPVTFPSDSALEFKQVRVITISDDETTIYVDTTWFGQQSPDGYMTRESNAWTLDGEHNVLLVTDAEGEYTFSLEGESFVVTFPIIGPSALSAAKMNAAKIEKVMIDGQLYIVRGGKIFNVLGQE